MKAVVIVILGSPGPLRHDALDSFVPYFIFLTCTLTVSTYSSICFVFMFASLCISVKLNALYSSVIAAVDMSKAHRSILPFTKHENPQCQENIIHSTLKVAMIK